VREVPALAATCVGDRCSRPSPACFRLLSQSIAWAQLAGSSAGHPGRIQPRNDTSCGSAKGRVARFGAPHSAARLFPHVRLLSEMFSWRRPQEASRSRTELSRREAWRSASQPPHRAEPFVASRHASLQRVRHARRQRDRTRRHQEHRGESSSGWSSAESPVRGIDPDLRIRRSPLESDSRRSAECEKFASAAYRQFRHDGSRCVDCTGNALCFRSVAVATAGVQNVMECSKAENRLFATYVPATDYRYPFMNGR